VLTSSYFINSPIKNNKRELSLSRIDLTQSSTKTQSAPMTEQENNKNKQTEAPAILGVRTAPESSTSGAKKRKLEGQQGEESGCCIATTQKVKEKTEIKELEAKEKTEIKELEAKLAEIQKQILPLREKKDAYTARLDAIDEAKTKRAKELMKTREEQLKEASLEEAGDLGWKEVKTTSDVCDVCVHCGEDPCNRPLSEDEDEEDETSKKDAAEAFGSMYKWTWKDGESIYMCTHCYCKLTVKKLETAKRKIQEDLVGLARAHWEVCKKVEKAASAESWTWRLTDPRLPEKGHCCAGKDCSSDVPVREWTGVYDFDFEEELILCTACFEKKMYEHATVNEAVRDELFRKFFA